MALEAYSIAVKLSLVSNVQAGLVAMSKHFAATNAQAEALQKRLAAIKAQALTGAALFGTGAAMAAPIVYAISKAAELQKQLLSVQMTTHGTTREMLGMRKAIEGVAGQTIFSNVDVAKMAKKISTSNTFTASQVTGVLPVYAKFADVQSLLKGTPYEQSVTEGIRLAHLAGKYEPKALAAYLNLLNKATLMVPGTLSEVGNALKYSQPAGKAILGISDENMILTTALVNRLGLSGSRGGTALINAMTRTIPGVFGSGLLTGKSYEALNAMHMIDKSGHSKFFTDGKFDVTKWMGGLSAYAAQEMNSHPMAVARQDIMRNIQHALGTNGGKVASLLTSPQALEMFYQMHAQFGGFGSVEDIQKRYADESVSQQAKNAQTNFQSLMTETGYALLPLVSTGLVKLNSGLQALTQWVTNNQGTVRALTLAFAGLSASLMFGGLVNLAAAGFRGLGLALSIFGVAGKGALLANVATGFKGIAGALVGNAGLVVAVGAAGYAIGSLINKLLGISNGEFGSWLYDKMHRADGSNVFTSSGVPSVDFVKRPIQVHTDIHLDGHRIASVVTKHQSRAMSGPQSGVSFVDALMGAPSPANPF